MDIEDIVIADPRSISTREPFSDLFSPRKDVIERIGESMKEKGYDPSQPVHVWKQKNCLVDGHQRRQAAIDAGCDVYVFFHDFESEDEAFGYAVRNQRDRRNLTDGELSKLVLAVDKRKAKGGDRKSSAGKSIVSRETIDSSLSSDDTAASVGTSNTKVNKVRSIQGYADLVKAVDEGTMSLNKADKVARARRRAEREALRAVEAEVAPESEATEAEGVEDALPTVDILAGLSSEDGEWLRKLPLYEVAGNHYLRDDAMIYRHVLPQIRATLMEVVGLRSPHDVSPLYRAVDKMCSVVNPSEWKVCTECGGGVSVCEKCKSAGYSIPGVR